MGDISDCLNSSDVMYYRKVSTPLQYVAKCTVVKSWNHNYVNVTRQVIFASCGAVDHWLEGWPVSYEVRGSNIDRRRSAVYASVTRLIISAVNKYVERLREGRKGSERKAGSTEDSNHSASSTGFKPMKRPVFRIHWEEVWIGFSPDIAGYGYSVRGYKFCRWAG